MEENKIVFYTILPFALSVILFIILAVIMNQMNNIYSFLGFIYLIGAIISIIVGIKLTKNL